MAYVDAWVTPFPKRKLAEVRRLSRKVGKIFLDHGALEYREWVADDVKWGKRTSFLRAVQQKPGETISFAYVVYKSRKDRDRVGARAMKDKRMAPMMDPKKMPFDAKRMIFGGFKPLVSL